MAYGSPNSLDEVGDYLAQVRGGRVSTPEEIEHLKQRYQRVGGQTPLLQITKSQDDDPYRAQLLETSQLVAKETGVTDWDFAFQSASGPISAWLGPSLKEKISEFSDKGIKRILVCPVGFVSDHLEILYDLDVEARDHANSRGVVMSRTLSLNDDPMFIEALAGVAKPILVRQIAAR